MVEARAYARATIAELHAAAAAKEKLAAEFAARERFTEADVDARIKGEREYLARFTESGRVTMDLGEGDVSVEDRRKKIDTMLDDFFKQEAGKPLMSFKECYIEITGDRRVTGRLEDCDRARLREAWAATSASRSTPPASPTCWATRSRAA
jgi:predicted phage-related endonuclease